MLLSHALKFALVVLVPFGAAQEIKLGEPRCPYSFSPPNSDAETTENANEELVIRIFNGNDKPLQGTGFIVDAMNGYVLTAGHLVIRAQQDPTQVIFATDPSGKRIRLRLVESLWASKNIDAALLQFVNPSDVRAFSTNTKGVDLALDYGTTPKGVLLGYGGDSVWRNPDVAARPRKQEIKVTGFVPGDTSQATTAGSIFDGDSGGPVFDATGRVFGIMIERVTGTDAYGKVLYLFKVHELMQRVFSEMRLQDLSENVDQSLRRGEYDVVRLEIALRPYRMTNKELAVLALRMRFEPDMYKKSAGLLSCPIDKALSDRRLGYIREQIVLPNEYTKRAELSLQRAAALASFHEWDAARNSFLETASLGKTLGSSQTEKLGWLGAAKSALELQDYERAQDYASSALRLAYKDNDEMRAALANRYLAEAGQQGQLARTKDVADAKTKGMVWVDTSIKVYHREGAFYGKSKRGKFMTEDEAQKAGFKAAKEPAGKKTKAEVKK